MAVVSELVGRRSRGIVWVCDIQSSSKYLNNDESAEALEKFLQRFLFLSIIFVEAAGGKFVKWTGDGFLAWFETPLLRDAGNVAEEVCNAAWNLSLYVNVSQLGVSAPVEFKIRHAVTMEHDALVIDLSYSKNRSTDVLGRAVVLAFRLSSIKAGFPNIITQGELLKLTKTTGTIHFQKLKLSKEDKVRYFKDEKWGTADIFASGDRAHRHLSVRTVLRFAKKAIDHAEGRRDSPAKHTNFYTKVLEEMRTGPDWAQEVEKTIHKFTSDELLGNLKRLVPMLEKQKEEGGAPSAEK
jgi:class 3 adenylate cyclase